jgi:peroxiredoxin
MDEVLAPRAAVPEFELDGSTVPVVLRQLRGRPVVLSFYPADWSPVCGDQMAFYNEVLSEIEKDGARLLGLSVDGVWCHKAFAGDRRLAFPLLADFEPKGAPLTTAVLTSVDASHTGSASGLNGALARTGGLIATALLGGVLAERGAALLSGFHAGALVGATAAAAAGLFALLFVSNAEGVDQSCLLSAPNRRPTVWSLSDSRQIHRPEPNTNLTRWRARGTVRSRAYCLAFSSDRG